LINNILKLGSANLLAQLLPFIVTPIATRIYAPESFGSFSVFISIVAIASVLASARYELALVIAKKDELKDLLLINIILCISFSLVLFVIIKCIFYYNEELYFENPELLYSPLAVFVNSLATIVTYYHTRHEGFKYLGNGSVLRSIVFCSLQLSLFLLFSQSLSLILSWVISTSIMAGYLILRAVPKLKVDIVGFSANEYLKTVANKYSNFPKFSMPASVISSTNSQFNIVALSYFFGKEILGYYALVERMLAAPISIIGNSIGQVYYSSIANKSEEEVYAIFKKISLRLILLASFLYLTFRFILSAIFTDIFGEDWSYSVVLLNIFSLQFCIQLSVSPLLMTLQKYRLSKVELMFQVSVMFSYASSYLYYYLFGAKIDNLLCFISGSVSLCYVMVYLYMNYYLKRCISLAKNG